MQKSLLPWLFCGIGALFYCFEYLLRITPSVMTTELMQHYDISAAAFGNLVAFYYYAYTPMQLPVGVLMDRFGPRRLLTFACLCCTLGSYLFASGNLIWMAGLGRFLVGFGSAFAFVGALKLATIWLPAERFALISGLTTTLGMVGAMFGELFLTGFVKATGWQQTVHMTGVIGIVIMLLILFVLRDKESEAGKEVAKHLLQWRELGLGLVNVLKKPQIWINGLIGSFLYLPTSAFAELWGVPFFEQTYHFSAERAAATSSMIFLGWAIGGPLAGLLSDKLKRRKFPILAGALIAALISFFVIYFPKAVAPHIDLLLVAFGIVSSVEVIIFAVGRENCAERFSGTAIATTNMLIMLSGALFQPLIGVFLDYHWDGRIVDHLHVYSSGDYQYAMAVIPLGLLFAFILGLFLKETHAKAQA